MGVDQRAGRVRILGHAWKSNHLFQREPRGRYVLLPGQRQDVQLVAHGHQWGLGLILIFCTIFCLFVHFWKERIESVGTENIWRYHLRTDLWKSVSKFILLNLIQDIYIEKNCLTLKEDIVVSVSFILVIPKYEDFNK